MYSFQDKCSLTSDNFFQNLKNSNQNDISKGDIINKRLESALSFNAKNTGNNNSFNQSPKINSGKFRQTIEKIRKYFIIKKLFIYI